MTFLVYRASSEFQANLESYTRPCPAAKRIQGLSGLMGAGVPKDVGVWFPKVDAIADLTRLLGSVGKVTLMSPDALSRAIPQLTGVHWRSKSMTRNERYNRHASTEKVYGVSPASSLSTNLASLLYQ
jgi:hypothetical protein